MSTKMTRIVTILGIVLILSVGTTSLAYGDVAPINGNFDDGIDPWEVHDTVGGLVKSCFAGVFNTGLYGNSGFFQSQRSDGRCGIKSGGVILNYDSVLSFNYSRDVGAPTGLMYVGFQVPPSTTAQYDLCYAYGIEVQGTGIWSQASCTVDPMAVGVSGWMVWYVVGTGNSGHYYIDNVNVTNATNVDLHMSGTHNVSPIPVGAPTPFYRSEWLASDFRPFDPVGPLPNDFSVDIRQATLCLPEIIDKLLGGSPLCMTMPWFVVPRWHIMGIDLIPWMAMVSGVIITIFLIRLVQER